MEAPATDDEAATDDELPALVDGISDEDGSSNEDEPVLVGTATSLAAHVLPRGYSDFFITRTTADEFSCASRQDVMAATFALRNLTLETQSCGKLHVHVGNAVQARWGGAKGDKWHAGKVVGVCELSAEEGGPAWTYDIAYNDGDRETRLAAKYVRGE